MRLVGRVAELGSLGLLLRGLKANQLASKRTIGSGICCTGSRQIRHNPSKSFTTLSLLKCWQIYWQFFNWSGRRTRVRVEPGRYWANTRNRTQESNATALC